MHIIYLAENIRHLRKLDNISQNELAEIMKVPRSTLNNWERGTSEPNLETILKLSQHFDVSPGDLISSRIKYLLPGDYVENVKVLAVTVDEINRSNIELVDYKAEAGYLESFQDPEYIRDLPRISFPNLPHGNYRGFEIQGESMLPVEPGSIIICRYLERIDQVKNGETYVLASNDGLVYKRVYKIKGKNKLLLSSDNSVFQPYEVNYEDVKEIWTYHAHLSFNNGKDIMDAMMEDKLKEMDKKIDLIYEHIIRSEEE